MAGRAQCPGAQQQRLRGGVGGKVGHASGRKFGGINRPGDSSTLAEGGQVLPPGDELALSIQSTFERVIPRRPVVIVSDIVLARPEQLNWCAD